MVGRLPGCPLFSWLPGNAGLHNAETTRRDRHGQALMLSKFTSAVDKLNEKIGHGVAWMTLALVLIQFTVVIMRYVFSFGFIAAQETIWYLHGLVFMLGAGYTLLFDGHVRVDVIYRGAGPRTKAWVDLIGAFVLLLPLCALTVWLSWGYVINAWRVLEQSHEESGLPLIYLYKTVIWAFAVFLGLQGLAMAAKAWMFLSGQSAAYPPGSGSGLSSESAPHVESEGV